MSTPRKDHPAQLTLFAQVDLVPQGDGTYRAIPRKPVQWMTIKEAAADVRMSEQAVRDWANAGLITARRVGLRKLQVDADSLRAFTEAMNHLK